MNAGPETGVIGAIVGGKYKIVRLMARGGMGVVYEALHTVVRRRFAIKFLRRDLAERRDILTRFQREAEAAGALENENLAAAVDFGISDDGTPYIVMEYLAGESLAALLERGGRLPISRAADLVSQACRGVGAAHAAGIVHRDLKPENLFVCRRENGTDLIKILDFGVAKLQALDDANMATRSGVVLGTAAYMSPEQARGEKLVDRRADVYALGAILYELVSQRKPHPGDSQNAVLHHIATQSAVPLGSVQPDLPAGLVELIGRTLASDPATRPPSADALAQGLAPFAHRETWPAPPEESGPARAALTSTVLAAEDGPRATPGALSLAGATVDHLGAVRPAPRGRRPRARIAFGAGILMVALAIAVGVGLRARAPGRTGARAIRALPASTHFFAQPSNTEAVQQIARLTQARNFHEAALLAAMEATPHAPWFDSGSPEEVESAVRKVVLRATHDGGMPVVVAYNHPFRDCSQYGAGGARDPATYQAWIDGFARGIGNERVVVILEPDSLGTIPYNTMLDGFKESCRPTVTDADGRTVPAPGATAADRYALLASAIDSLASHAPNALVYLDGTHSAWLPVGEIAHRLAQAGVQRARGFAVNVANFQTTSEAIKYGTRISTCLGEADRNPGNGGKTAAFRDCNAEHAAPAPPSAAGLAHFVIDTSRNGRGPLDATIYAAPPFNQPPAVIEKLHAGSYCNPPGAGIGLRPTANTGVALVDAYLWIKGPGESDGPCDIAGGPRAWDYSKHNPWQVAGDAQRHFDPLWGMVDPQLGQWFPEQALELARNASPPLEQLASTSLASPDEQAAAAAPAKSSGPPSAVRPLGRPQRRAAGRPTEPRGADEPSPPPPVTMDQQNPYN